MLASYIFESLVITQAWVNRRPGDEMVRKARTYTVRARNPNSEIWTTFENWTILKVHFRAIWQPFCSDFECSVWNGSSLGCFIYNFFFLNIKTHSNCQQRCEGHFFLTVFFLCGQKSWKPQNFWDIWAFFLLLRLRLTLCYYKPWRQINVAGAQSRGEIWFTTLNVSLKVQRGSQ